MYVNLTNEPVNIVYTNNTNTTTPVPRWALGTMPRTTAPSPTFITVDPDDPDLTFTPDEDHTLKLGDESDILAPWLVPGRVYRPRPGPHSPDPVDMTRRDPLTPFFTPGSKDTVRTRTHETEPDTCPAAVIRRGKPTVCGKKDCVEHA